MRRVDISPWHGWRVQQKIRSIRRGSKNIAWKLTEAQAQALLVADCHYCGSPQPLPHPGTLDLIDWALGYVDGNVVPCCSWCSQMKKRRSEQEFLSQCEKIVAKCRQRLGIG